MTEPSLNEDESKSWRDCVGIVLLNDAGLIFVGERIDLPGQWQMPQGGMEPGEAPQEAALRELREEIGTDKAMILGVFEGEHYYHFPETGVDESLSAFDGQRMRWVLARYTGSEEDIILDGDERPEFSRYEWVRRDEVMKRIVDFKRPVYAAVLEQLDDAGASTE